MVNFVNLRQTGSGWEFESEAALEDFLEENLPALFGLHPLKRQHYVNEQFCDIVAAGDNKNLVILELKNTEDRYVVQQLTRYYDGLREQQAFSDQVDYSQPVRLVAIAPSFHRDNLIDRKYHTLAFQFLKFSVISEDEKFYFQIIDIDTEEQSILQISQIQTQEPGVIASPPRRLQTMLTQCNDQTKYEILRIREHLLTFDRRMQEFSSNGIIKYGNNQGKSSKICAELCTDSQSNIILFLWLPYKGGKSQRVGRARIWTDWQGHALIEGYVSSGIGAQITSQKKVIANLIEKFNPEDYQSSVYWRNARKWNRYYLKEFKRIQKQIEEEQPISWEDLKLRDKLQQFLEELRREKLSLKNPCKPLNYLVDLSLNKWLERL
ncbi:endonuclease NucS domain-containing protein [Planktothricoides raciborskii]|uniref:Endonuclease NucS domain-containing protein n=1 Tax=Planktothricoides raciborskii GIHE-MW2 TaxID=2792601 RepID=A0AAU8J8X1_9CYAN